jgi:ADP-heptose:LPS heptosyltransferase
VQILVIHPGALGDIILSLPTLRILRAHFANARLILAANTDYAGAVAAGHADRILSISSLPLHRLYSSDMVPPEDQLGWRSYDRIVSWTGRGNELFARRLMQIHSNALVSSWKPKRSDRRHVSRLFADSLHPWLVPPLVLPSPEIVIDPTSRQEGDAWLRDQGLGGDRPLFALHPGAGSIAKRWPLSRFLNLARRLRMLGDLLVVEGPAETGLGIDLAKSLGSGTHLASELPLRRLAAVLRSCCAFVGNDSGITHLAAGLQVPCVALFGPSLPEHWAPLGSRVSVLRDAAGCLACSIGSEGNHCCLDNISVEAVWRQICMIADPANSLAWIWEDGWSGS